MCWTLRLDHGTHEWQGCRVPFGSCPGGIVLRSVALLALPNTAPLEFGLLCEVFGIDRREDGVPAIDFRVVTADLGRLPFRHGMALDVPNDLSFAEDANIVAVPAFAWAPLQD